MRMKRLIAIMATVTMAVGVLAGCGSKTDNGDGDKTPDSGKDSTQQEENKDDKKEEAMKVSLCTDEGGVNDKSFNQTANEGCNKAVTDFGVEYKYVESAKKEDYEPNLQALVDDGSKLVFACGYQLADAVKAAAESNPDTNFCIIDSVVEGSNVESITFKEEEGSFLMGVIAGLTTKTNKVGFIGGKDVETIVKFESGFAAGVAAVNEEAAKGLVSADGTSAGTAVKYADSFADTNKGYELAKSLYESGCDVIYHAAGGVGVGLFQAAQEERKGGNDVWAIGVDMDQAVSLPDYADVILSSMMKRVDIATYDTIKELKEDNFKAGTKALGIAEGGVGMAATTSDNTAPEVMKKAEEFEDKIKAGEIEVPGTRAGVVDYVKGL